METFATRNPPRDRSGRAPIFALALTVVAAVAGVSFFAGWLIGRIVS
jgi:hypothetical protein